MIRFNDVGLILNNVAIIQNISFEVGKGEFIYLLGPSGAGKSSILKLIHLDLAPTAGSVFVRGMDTRKVPRSQMPHLRRSIGFIFQDYKLLKHKTAFENVAFALEVTGAKRSVIKHKTLHALQTVGLSHRMNHLPANLSGGECQRIAIARAIVLEPFILLADEPTGNLDDENARAIVDLLEAINHTGCAVLMATHRPNIAARPAARCIEITGGKLKGCT